MSNSKKHDDQHSEATGDRFASARDAVRRAGDGLDANPLAVVAGGLALGAVVGALLPRSERERALLAPVGERVGGAVTAALAAGREAGRTELADLGLNRDAARDQARNVVDGLLKAASTAGSAAARAAASGARGAD